MKSLHLAIQGNLTECWRTAQLFFNNNKSNKEKAAVWIGGLVQNRFITSPQFGSYAKSHA